MSIRPMLQRGARRLAERFSAAAGLVASFVREGAGGFTISDMVLTPDMVSYLAGDQEGAAVQTYERQIDILETELRNPDTGAAFLPQQDDKIVVEIREGLTKTFIVRANSSGQDVHELHGYGYMVRVFAKEEGEA